MDEWKQVRELLERAIDSGLYQVILSHARDREKIEKVKVRPIMLKGELFFQETAYRGTQVFHTNYKREDMIGRIFSCLEGDFRQCEVEGQSLKASVLVSKKGKLTIKCKENRQGRQVVDLSHNRKKVYLLEEGKPVPFLVDLGVQTWEGKIVKAKYDKFKQINRFMEFIQDILPTLTSRERLNIVDFGCGKSYLTFAMYYYLHQLKGLDVRIVGLDLKKDVVAHCNSLAEKYGYHQLHFQVGDISSYQEGEGEPIDMVVTLHACDTATDYALAKAIGWKARVILSVPCCQHEVNQQIDCEELYPLLQYGLLKERLSALCTDAIRAGVLEEQGYEVQILEFIDMLHTPKNILIRAVRKEKGNRGEVGQLKKMTELLHIDTTLQKLMEHRSEGSYDEKNDS